MTQDEPLSFSPNVKTSVTSATSAKGCCCFRQTAKITATKMEPIPDITPRATCSTIFHRTSESSGGREGTHSDSYASLHLDMTILMTNAENTQKQFLTCCKIIHQMYQHKEIRIHFETNIFGQFLQQLQKSCSKVHTS